MVGSCISDTYRLVVAFGVYVQQSMTGFPLETVYRITNITQDCPATVTLEETSRSNAFSVSNGQTITISGVQGMFQVNENRYIVANLNELNNTFDLYRLLFTPIDTRAFTPYISGGEINIVSYPPQAGQPPGLMYNNQ